MAIQALQPIEDPRQASFQDLLDVVLEQNPGMDVSLITDAYEFADDAHRGEVRKSGEPYIIHPLAVALILAKIQQGPEALAAALLHDVIEDTDATREDIQERFGEVVAQLVEGVTKLSRIHFAGETHNPEERANRESDRQAENLRKMFLAMVDDARVVLIKLADRLHNMRTLDAVPTASQQRIARETMDIYAPLANRLGMWQFKSELEDLAFQYLDPQTYGELRRQLERRGAGSTDELERITDEIRSALANEGISADISSREKHTYSIHRKMLRKDTTFDEIYDVVGIRIIVEDKQDCYGALGVVHSLWRPIRSEFDDYIATPKDGHYQSIHTAIVGPHGHVIEIQIRSHEMHQVAEYGIAAHWRYKEGKRVDETAEAKIAWLRQLMDWRDAVSDAQEFVESFKSDILNEMIYVFTPNGDIVELPSGATPLDFAYRIHTEVGHQCVGAKVNDKMVPLDAKLQNGQIVRIMTGNSNRGPSRDWLMPSNGFVTTASAREKIRQWFRRRERDENIIQGREIIDRELRRIGVEVKLEDIAARFTSFQRVDDFLAAVGYGGITPQQVATRLAEGREVEVLPPTEKPTTSTVATGLKVMGVGDLYTRLAACCKPAYGDQIVGYVTRGRGITVHRADCHNMKNVDDEGRKVPVSWGDQAARSYPVEVRLEAWDRVGMLRDVTALLADERINLLSVLTNVRPDQTVTVLMTVEISSMEQLSRLLQKLESIRDVFDVRRETSGTSRTA